MIDLSYVQNAVEMDKKSKLLKQHPYEIWKGKNEKWYTYLPDDNKGRVLKKRNSEEEIKNVVINYWKEQEENPTIKIVFYEWLNGKRDREEIEQATFDRYERQFIQCFKDIENKRIKQISEYDIEEFVLNSIYEKSLTTKGFSNMRTILYGIFKLAKKKKYVDFSITEIMNDMEISRKSFRKNIKSEDEEVFNEKELPIILDYLNHNLDIINLGILLVFKTGLRIGELAALKKCDIGKNVIHVSRTEVKYKINKEMVYEVRDFPKTEAGIRDVYLPDKYLWILKRISLMSAFGEYLFERDGERIRAYVFNNRLRTICKKNGIKPKSPHKIRKTYGTLLIDSGVEESLVLSQMGHTNIATTKKYYYKNRKSPDSKAESINNIVGL